MTKQLKTGGLLLLLSIAIFACKKDEVVSKPEDALSGSWAEVPEDNYSRQLLFGITDISPLD